MSSVPLSNEGCRSLLLDLPSEVILCIADVCTPTCVLNLVCCNKHLYGLLYGFLRRLGATGYGGRAILWAAFHGHLEYLKYLHQLGAPITQIWGVSDTRLKSGDENEDFIFECTPDPESRKKYTSWPLRVACRNGHNHIVSWLLDNGADVNASNTTNDTATPLYLALWHGQDATAKLLIERGATVVTEPTGETLSWSTTLSDAVFSSAFETVKLLLTFKPCAIDVADFDGVTPLGRVLLPRRRWHPYVSPGTNPTCLDAVDMDMLRLLLAAGASLTTAVRDLDGQGAGSFVPLHCAILEGSYEAASAILEAGADIDSVSEGFQPLHLVFGHASYWPQSGRSEPRWKSWLASRAKLVEKLLAAGADPNGRASPLTDGVLDESSILVNSLDEYAQLPVDGVTPLMYAAANGSCLDSISILIRSGANVNAVDDWGQNALHWAVRSLHWAKRIDSWTPGEKLNDPYLWNRICDAQNRRPAEVCELLLKNGCDAALRDMEGQCAVEALLASDADHLETKKLLRVLLGHLSDACVHHRCLERTIEGYLRSGRFDDAACLLSDTDRCGERGPSVSAARFLQICHEFPVRNNGTDETLKYFRGAIRFAEMRGLIHLSQPEEEDGHSRDIRSYLLTEEAEALEFTNKWFPWLFEMEGMELESVDVQRGCLQCEQCRLGA